MEQINDRFNGTWDVLAVGFRVWRLIRVLVLLNQSSYIVNPYKQSHNPAFRFTFLFFSTLT